MGYDIKWDDFGGGYIFQPDQEDNAFEDDFQDNGDYFEDADQEKEHEHRSRNRHRHKSHINHRAHDHEDENEEGEEDDSLHNNRENENEHHGEREEEEEEGDEREHQDEDTREERSNSLVDQAQTEFNSVRPIEADAPKEVNEPSASASASDVAAVPQETEPLFELGDGLPALPPKREAPLRQGEDDMKGQGLDEPAPPEFSVPPGSDLGAVGKIGVYQMEHNMASRHTNFIFWTYVLTILVTFVLAKKK